MENTKINYEERILSFLNRNGNHYSRVEVYNIEFKEINKFSPKRAICEFIATWSITSGQQKGVAIFITDDKIWFQMANLGVYGAIGQYNQELKDRAREHMRYLNPDLYYGQNRDY